MWAILISKALRLERVNDGSQFAQLYLPPTRLSTSGRSYSAFTPHPQSITALLPVLISRPAEGRMLSWPGWIGEILNWFARLETVIHSVIAAAAGNRTHGHRVVSPNYFIGYSYRGPNHLI